ncbi:hypothetical protein CBM2634_A90034 [Cupriavidus taiwanensis]|uniref:Uncharacterized protein n=1 Tax=Cupriavidus taiwanensis TaxID=164546 RepID=A0A375J4E1_9BURK|nr:hypothetical protein CBM2634_A90034 [Cupriavidus taiwanensis]
MTNCTFLQIIQLCNANSHKYIRHDQSQNAPDPLPTWGSQRQAGVRAAAPIRAAEAGAARIAGEPFRVEPGPPGAARGLGGV